MPSTSRMQHPYPDQDQNPWYPTWKSFAASLDAADFASRSDRNLVATPLGTVAVSAVGYVSFSAPYEILHPLTGSKAIIDDDEFTLLDGQIAYVSLVRAPLSNYQPPVQVGTSIPSDHNSLVIAARIGSVVWVRGVGHILLGSESAASPLSGATFLAIQTLSGKVEVAQAPITVSRTRLDLRRHRVPGATQTLKLRIEAQNTTGVLDSDIDLYDVTGADVLLHHIDVTLGTPSQFEATITPVDSDSERIYELRGGLSSAPGVSTDRLLIWSAALEVESIKP